MKKKICAMLFALVICLVTVVPSFAVPAPPYSGAVPQERMYPLLVDDADILTDTEEQQLLAKLEEASAKQNMDIAVVTIEALDDRDIEDYADDFCDYYGYGQGENRNCVLLLISMGERKWHITTTGSAEKIFTDAGIEYIGEKMVPDMSAGNYAAAFTTYVETCDAFAVQAENGEPYDVDNMPEEPVTKEPLSLIWIPISIIVGVLISLIVVGRMKAKLKTVRFQAAANSYVVPGSMAVTGSRDEFITTNVVRTEKPKSSSSGSGGSSTHTSSSGTSHGGGGGSF